MWLLDPQILCPRHLLGEHNELHKLAGAIIKEKNLTGYYTKKLVDPVLMYFRHTYLVKEMIDRGYKHKSDLQLIDYGKLPQEALNIQIDLDYNLKDLLERCPKCRERYERYKNG